MLRDQFDALVPDLSRNRGRQLLLDVDADAAQDVAGLLSPLPVVFIHGTGDQVVPAHHSERLYQAAATPKQLWLLPNVPHTAGLELLPNRSRLLSMFEQTLNGIPPAP